MSHTAVVAGVGPGLGASIAEKFAAEGCHVGLFARTEDTLADVENAIADTPGDSLSVPTDVTEEADVREGFERVREEFGPVDTFVHNASAASWEGLLETSPADFERPWRVNAYGGYLCAREAVPDMLENEGGTVIFTGATSAVRGRGGALSFSSAKFAARGLAESMAREVGPDGIHVAHVIVDGQILTPSARDAEPDRDEETYLDPDEIAETYWHLVQQDRSAWTLELDLRPHLEDF